MRMAESQRKRKLFDSVVERIEQKYEYFTYMYTFTHYVVHTYIDEEDDIVQKELSCTCARNVTYVK